LLISTVFRVILAASYVLTLVHPEYVFHSAQEANEKDLFNISSNAVSAARKLAEVEETAV
jgi:hypothetical protein